MVRPQALVLAIFHVNHSALIPPTVANGLSLLLRTFDYVASMSDPYLDGWLARTGFLAALYRRKTQRNHIAMLHF